MERDVGFRGAVALRPFDFVYLFPVCSHKAAAKLGTMEPDKEYGIALPWVCALIGLWASEKRTIAITKLNHQHRQGNHNYCRHYYCWRIPTRFQY